MDRRDWDWTAWAILWDDSVLEKFLQGQKGGKNIQAVL